MNLPQKTFLVALEPRPLAGGAGDLHSRRDALRMAGVAAAGLVILPQANPLVRETHAAPVALPWIAWAGRVAVGAAIAWLVNRLLDRQFLESDVRAADKLRLKEVNPSPATDRFHNAHAEKHVVTDGTYNFGNQYSARYGYFFGLNGYVRTDAVNPIPAFKDFNLPELKRVAYEEPRYGTVLFPCGLRESPTPGDRAEYYRTCDQYRVDPDAFHLEYVRPFSGHMPEAGAQVLYVDPVTGGLRVYHRVISCLAFGVRSARTGEKDLLISG